MKKGHRLVRSSKGFLFEADDVKSPVVPDLAMEEWLARWSEDTRPRRRITITRRTDGSQVRLTASLLAYGAGVETSISIERVERDAPARQVATETKVEVPE